MHVLLPEHAVDKVTDVLGVTLADMVCLERLCEDATSNLNKLISTARTLQRVEQSSTLLKRHILEASELLGTPIPPSTPSIELSKLTATNNETLFYAPTSEIDLYDVMHGTTSECTCAPLALEITMTSEHAPISLDTTKPSDHTKSIETLAPTVYRYLTTLCQQLVAKDHETREEALAEVRSSTRVSLILPHLLQFLDLRLRDNERVAGNTIRLLIVYKNMLQNDRVYLEPYIPSLLDECYSMCCDWTESRESVHNTTAIIEHSSDVTAFIILKFNNVNTKYYDKYTRFCGETIESDEMSLSALGSLSLLSKLGPQCVNDRIIPLIFGLYSDMFKETDNLMVDNTAIHIKRILKLTLFSFYNSIYKSLHITKMAQLVKAFNRNHSPYQLQPADQTSKQRSRQTEDKSSSLLKHSDICDKLEECGTMVAPTWPHMSRHSPLLAKKMNRELSKKLKETFGMFGSLKGKMLPAERRVFLRKKTDKQIKSNQIYNLYNNMAQLRYFL